MSITKKFFNNVTVTGAFPDGKIVFIGNDTQNTIEITQAAAGVAGTQLALIPGFGGNATSILPGGAAGGLDISGGTGGDGNATRAAGAGGNVVIYGGFAGANNGGGGAAGGSFYIDGGVGTTSNGTVFIGTNFSDSIQIGTTGIATQINGKLITQEGIKVKVTTTAASYTILLTDYIVAVTSTAAVRTLTLPAAASAGVGALFIIKDASGGAATNNIIIDGNASETIDGSLTYNLTGNYQSVSIYCTGTAWLII